MIGRYRLDLAVESGCAALPEEARARTYTADIGPYAGAGANYDVRLYDATFVYGLTCGDPRFPHEASTVDNLFCNRLMAFGTSDALEVFSLPQPDDDNWRGIRIMEPLSSGTWLEIQSTVTGRFENGRLTAVGTGQIHHWLSIAPYRYDYCSTSGLRMTFHAK